MQGADHNLNIDSLGFENQLHDRPEHIWKEK